MRLVRIEKTMKTRLLCLVLLFLCVPAHGQQNQLECSSDSQSICNIPKPGVDIRTKGESGPTAVQAMTPKTATEISAGAVVANVLYPAGDIRRYDASGGVDYAAAITAAYKVAEASGQPIIIPAGAFSYSTPLNLGSASVSWRGAGSGQSVLQYNGHMTNIDCISIGDGKKEVNRLTMEGISFRSLTVMTGGSGVHFRQLTRSTLHDVRFGEQDGPRNFFHGVWFDGADFDTVTQFQARAQRDAVRVNGFDGRPGADLFLWGGKIGGAAIGLHIGGAMGGIEVDATDIIGNAVNVQVDQSIVAVSNREILLGAQVALDSAGTKAQPFSGTDLLINDAGGALIFVSDTWIASASTLIKVDALGGFLKITGGFLFNAFNTHGGNGDAIDIEPATAAVQLTGTRFQAINGASIRCEATSPCSDVSMSAVVYGPETIHTLINVNPATTIVTPGRLVAGGGDVRRNFPLAFDANPAQYFYESETLGGAMGIGYFGPTSAGGWLEMYKSRGATAAMHGPVRNRDALGGIGFSGDTGTRPLAAAEVAANVDGAASSGSIPGMLRLATTSIGETTPTDRVTIGNQGNVVIKAPVSGDPLTVHGMRANRGVTGWVCYDRRTGQFSYDTADSCGAGDEADASVIEDFNWDATEKIALLRPVMYHCKPESSCEFAGDKIGLDAREVAKVDRRLVFYREDGAPSSVDYSKVSVLLVRAFQAQHRQLITLWGVVALLLAWCAHLQWSMRRM